jgi:hypothetical protein
MYKLVPEDWQTGWLRQKIRGYRALIVARGGGKSQMIGCKALHETIYGNRDVLILTPRQRNSEEVLRHLRNGMNNVLHPPTTRDTQSTIEFATGKRILALSPGIEGEESDWSRVRGLHLPSVLCDESAFIPDEQFPIILPILSAEKDPLLILSGTPSGQRGLLFNFHERDDVQKTIVPGTEIPHLNIELMADLLPDLEFRQEMLCEFLSGDDTAWRLGSVEQINNMVVSGEI